MGSASPDSSPARVEKSGKFSTEQAPSLTTLESTLESLTLETLTLDNAANDRTDPSDAARRGRGRAPNSPSTDSEPRKLDGQKSDGGNNNNNTSAAGTNNANNANKPQFKKGHKKSKSSRIEFNFDPDAYEGSTRILDVFGFPATFKTHNLHEIFHEYENMRGGYRIKWMDDTRALIIFEHPVTARKAYLDNVANQMATVKPYNGPTDFLQKNSNNTNNNNAAAAAVTPRARPQTTDVVARRMVHNALGVRGQRSPDQRQAERQLFQNARDQRDQKRAEEVRRAQELEAAFNE